jgi:hypothetical protein
MKQTIKKEWEGEFDKKWKTNSVGIGKWSGMSHGGYPVYNSNKIKHFISTNNET